MQAAAAIAAANGNAAANAPNGNAAAPNALEAAAQADVAPPGAAGVDLAPLAAAGANAAAVGNAGANGASGDVDNKSPDAQGAVGGGAADNGPASAAAAQQNLLQQLLASLFAPQSARESAQGPLLNSIATAIASRPQPGQQPVQPQARERTAQTQPRLGNETVQALTRAPCDRMLGAPPVSSLAPEKQPSAVVTKLDDAYKAAEAAGAFKAEVTDKEPKKMSLEEKLKLNHFATLKEMKTYYEKHSTDKSTVEKTRIRAEDVPRYLTLSAIKRIQYAATKWSSEAALGT